MAQYTNGRRHSVRAWGAGRAVRLLWQLRTVQWLTCPAFRLQQAGWLVHSWITTSVTHQQEGPHYRGKGSSGARAVLAWQV